MAELPVVAQRFQGFAGTYNTETGELKGQALVDALALGVGGNASKADVAQIREKLAGMNGQSTQNMLDRLARNTDSATGAQTPPDDYSKSGRYSVASGSSDVREGFKDGPSDHRVTDFQQMLYNNGSDKVRQLLGTSGENGNGVDGLYGPNTRAAFDQYNKERAGQTTPARADDTSGTGGTCKRETPATVAHDLSGAMNRDTPDTNLITKDLSSMSNAQMKSVDQQMKTQTGKGLQDTIAGMNADNIQGNASLYKDLMGKMAQGNRNEGINGRASDPVVDEYANKLGAAGRSWTPVWWGSDRSKINDVFAHASPAQLQELDHRFQQGFTTDSGKHIQYSDGLAGYIKNNTYSGAQQDALVAQLTRPSR